MVTLTPNLRHVRNVGIMGPRMVGRPDQPIPDIVKRMRLLPIATPVALSLGAIIGADVIAFLPIGNWLLHVILTVLVGAALAAGVYGLSFLLQRRMYAQVQTLLPRRCLKLAERNQIPITRDGLAEVQREVRELIESSGPT